MNVLFAKDIREIESNAITGGFSGLRMMENAGAAATNVIVDKYEVKGKSVVVVAGNGNNGGDGFVVARKLYDAGADVCIILVAGMPNTESAKETLSKLSTYPIRVYGIDDSDAPVKINNADFLVDAIFGIGFHGQINEDVAMIIERFNRSNAVKIALDLPSGCECDTGAVSNACVNADITITFIAVKPCHVLYPASDYCGKLVRVGIGISPKIMNSVTSNITIIENGLVKSLLPKRKKNFHKGQCGTAVQLCGSYGMAGAAILSAKAALRSGAGLVKAILPKSIYPIAAAKLLEAVYIPCDDTADGTVGIDSLREIAEALASADSLLIGCGLSDCKSTADLVSTLIPNLRTPIVLDADGINIVSKNIDILLKSEAPMVLTPHPAEMARLMRTTADEVQRNRFKVAHAFSTRFNKVLVLKGANTIVALPNGELYVCMAGNPGMAVGGSGDVLAGIINSLLAQGMSPQDAAVCGVQIHAFAGDMAASKMSIHSMLPTDIIDTLPSLFKEYEG